MEETVRLDAILSFRGPVEGFKKLVGTFQALGPETLFIDTVPLPESWLKWHPCRFGCMPVWFHFLGERFLNDLIEKTPRIKVDGIRGGIRTAHYHINDREVALLDRGKFQDWMKGIIIVDGKKLPDLQKEFEDVKVGEIQAGKGGIIIDYHAIVKFDGPVSKFKSFTEGLQKLGAEEVMINTVPIPDKPADIMLSIYDPRYGGRVHPTVVDNPLLDKILTKGQVRIPYFPFPGGIRNPHLHFDGGITFINQEKLREAMGIIIVETKNMG